MKKYNHAFTIAFSIVTTASCETEKPLDYPSENELFAAIEKRIAALKNSPGEIFEAVGAPHDTDIEEEGPIPPPEKEYKVEWTERRLQYYDQNVKATSEAEARSKIINNIDELRSEGHGGMDEPDDDNAMLGSADHHWIDIYNAEEIEP